MIKWIIKGVGAFGSVMMAATTLAPASETETNALGPDHERFDLVQMRLARAMMNVAPEFTVAKYSEATGIPPDIIRQHLEAKAAGEIYITGGPTDADYADTAPAEPSNISIRAGGAKFVTAD